MAALLCVLNLSLSPNLQQGAHVAESWDGHVVSFHCSESTRPQTHTRRSASAWRDMVDRLTTQDYLQL